MSRYKYIFWDLDGTIANTYEGISKCIRYALEPFGVQVKEEDMLKFIGPPLRCSFPEYCGLDRAQTEAAVARYRERYMPIGVYECEMFPGVKEAIERFCQAGCVQILTSSKPEPQCLEILKKFGILKYFDEVVGASLDGKIDTKDQVLTEALRRLAAKDKDLQKDQVVLIGDTRYDAQGAVRIGIDCVGISYGFGTGEELLADGAVCVYPDLKTLQDALLI